MTTTNESSKPDDGGPAFPHPDYLHTGDAHMSLRAYAAIKLRVADSGIDWLDDMIRTSMQDEFAAKAMSGMLADPNFPGDVPETAELAYDYAEAMLKARG
ncbi:hypothetical protein [Burkholderia gladioli]|uniref:hypothetical protein n=1 Tax=Burkholderia gladioli TaxID=28095 RepID=UPI00163FA426|nr:hypothetical protein [Burkholderia gladioli]